MSGIYGIWRLDRRPLDPREMERMWTRSCRRGSERTSIAADRWLTLGHVAASTTTGTSVEKNSIESESPAAILVSDARIDNRPELLSRLGLDTASAKSLSDADLLMAAYRRWGTESAARVIGEFAFAVWDARRNALICVRDHFGVRPLFYIWRPGLLFGFGPDVEAVLALLEGSPEVDGNTVARHLMIPIDPKKNGTYYREVRKVLPAHALRVSWDGIVESPYWRIDPTRETKLSSVAEYAEALRSTFREAVECRTRGVDPMGSMLSGGLDSSAITMIASRALSESRSPLHTLSAVYPAVPESDERGYIEDVLRQVDAVPHFFAADAVNPIAEIDAINRSAGGATRGRNLYLNWELGRVARQAGVNVVLDGYDGDAIVSHGEAYLSELALAGKWWKLAGVALPFSRRRGTPWAADYRALVRYGRHWQRIEKGDSSAAPPRIPAGMPVSAEFARTFADRLEPREVGRTERETHAQHLHSAMLMEVLGWVEACGAAQGVEIRFPFFDVRVAELCVSMPAELKLRRGWTRFVMRRAMEGIVPRTIQWRVAKANMYAGWARAYRTFGADRVTELLVDSSSRGARFLDLDRLKGLHARFLDAGTTQAEESAMWRGVSLLLWLNPKSGTTQ